MNRSQLPGRVKQVQITGGLDPEETKNVYVAEDVSQE